MKTFTLGELALMKYGKLPPKEVLESGCPIFTGYRVSGYAREWLYEDPMLVIVARGVGGTGDVKISPPRSWITNLSIVLDLNEAKVDKRFLCYFLGEQSLKEKLNTGSAQAQITVNALSTYQVTIPPLHEQRRIASILSAYDDLIENNTRRIAILEEMARLIYEEWFVRFRFPGHEDVHMFESDLGLLPEGWHASSIGKVAAYINRGLAPKYDDDAACLVINQKCIRGQRLSLGEARKQSKGVPVEKLVRLGDVLINSTGVGTLGRVAQVLEKIDNCTVDTHVSIVRPGKDCSLDYFGMALLARQENFESLGVGSTGQTELGRGRIAETAILMPTLEIQNEFSNRVGPMRRLAVTLQRKNQNLRATRDLLLPKLISGEIDVSAVPAPESIAA